MIALPLLVVVVGLWLYHQFVWRRKAFPPGPTPLPFIGNFHQINLANPARSMLQWRQRFGPVFTVWLPKPIVVLASHHTLQEALVRQGEAFAGRPTSFLYSLFTRNRENGDGVILCQRERWAVNRAFALRVFRDFGMGRDVMAQKILMHAETLVDFVKAKMADAKAVTLNPHSPLAYCVGNIIHDLIIGRTYAYGDDEFDKFKGLIDSTLKDVASWQMMMVDTYPALAPFFPLFHRYRRNGFALQQFFLDEIERHAAELSEDGEPRDFMEAYLREMKYQPANPHFNKLTLALTAGDLWTGGMETSVTTLRWGLIFLMYYPTVQRRLHAEIDEVLCGAKPAYADRLRMPYTAATLSELQRICNVLPWHIPHRVLRDATVDGVFFSAGTDVMPQFGAVHTDPDAFPQPDEFRPERFLDAQGNFASRHDMNPFGLGKRSCLGENLARYELFLIFTTLLQQFEFARTEGRPLPSMARTPGMTSVPQEYECEVRLRPAAAFDNNNDEHMTSRN